MSSEGSKTSSSSRLILGLAAIIALAAIGIAVWKRSAPASETATAPAMPAATDPASMIASLEARLKERPDDADGWRMLGQAFFETGKYAESATAYARATQIDPKKAVYWSSLGEARVMAGSGDVPPDAKSAFEKAIALDAKDPRARYFLGVAKDMSGDHKGAIDDWLALLADTPAGAPWEADVRQLVTEVAAKEKIDITGRLAALKPAPATGGAAIATAPIPGPTARDMQAATGLPKGQQDAMIQGMVDGLEAKLKANPQNLPGWIMLMRSRVQLGETAKASAAYANAKRAFAGDTGNLGQIDAAARELGVR